MQETYEKVILELFRRVQILEEKVAALSEPIPEHAKTRTADVKRYIEDCKKESALQGAEFLILTAGDIHRTLELRYRMPLVCNAMRQCMDECDDVLYSPPSGQSSALKIKYYL